MNTNIRPGHAGNGQSHRLDAAQVVEFVTGNVVLKLQFCSTKLVASRTLR